MVTPSGIELSSSQRKQLQRNLLFAMDYIHSLCVKHGIQYSLFYGSLIGAVVHKGFIPWDDDIDLAMTKTNFHKFVRVWQAENDSRFFLQSRETEKQYIVPCQVKIRINGTLLLETVDKHRNIHHGVSIDIVMFEDIDDDLSSLKSTKRYFSLFRDKYYFHQNKKYLNFKGLIYHLYRRILPPFTIERTAQLFLRCASSYQNPDSRMVFLPYSYQDDVYCREWLSEYRLYPFEGREYLGFADYDHILRVRYPTYMILPDMAQRKTNHKYEAVKLLNL